MLVHYEGELGTFDYNTLEFEIVENRRFTNQTCGISSYLHYIGPDCEDGRQIIIPNGIIFCNEMFARNKTMRITPSIPKSVRVCDYMFSYCGKLTNITKLPPTIQSANHMFSGTHITEVEYLPSQLQSAESMFSCCRYLMKVTATLPSSLRFADGMFEECNQLQEVPKMQYGVEIATRMFSFCSELKGDITLPNSIIKANSMFSGCYKIEKVNNFPNRLRNGSEMFAYCSKLKTIPDYLPDTLENAFGMFASCVCDLNKTVKNLPESLKKAQNMYVNNVKLRQVRFGNPYRLTNEKFAGMFTGCCNLDMPWCFKTSKDQDKRTQLCYHLGLRLRDTNSNGRTNAPADYSIPPLISITQDSKYLVWKGYMEIAFKKEFLDKERFVC